MVSWTEREESRGEVLELMLSSGERGDLMMEPRKMGPDGGESRVGARKYVFGVGGILVVGSVSRDEEGRIIESRSGMRMGDGCRLDIRLWRTPWREEIVMRCRSLSKRRYKFCLLCNVTLILTLKTQRMLRYLCIQC